MSQGSQTESELREQVESTLTSIESASEEIASVSGEIMRAYGGLIYMNDMLVTATLHRALCLVRGFVDLVRSRNFLATAPLLRLQLDNSLRIYAVSLVDDPNNVIRRILSGERIDRMKDRNGRRMTDKYLRDGISRVRPWVGPMYEDASEYIHLSGKHVFHSWNFEEQTMTVSGEDFTVDDEDYLNLLNSFQKATDLLLEIARTWLYVKSHPDDPHYNRWARYLQFSNESGEEAGGDEGSQSGK